MRENKAQAEGLGKGRRVNESPEGAREDVISSLGPLGLSQTDRPSPRAALWAKLSRPFGAENRPGHCLYQPIIFFWLLAPGFFVNTGLPLLERTCYLATFDMEKPRSWGMQGGV